MKEKSHGMASVLAALAANLLVAISKFVGFAFSGSTAMLNESIHSVVDCGNQILLLIGDKRAKGMASESHPFGESRAKYFFSIVVAMMLFFAGGALGIMEATEKLFHPEHSVENTWLVMGILAFGMIVECFSLRVAMKEIAELNKEKLPLFRFLRESRHSEVLIIFAEDLCAVIGLLLAMLGTILVAVTGLAFFDALSGLLIGLMLCLAALFLAREFYSLIIGESMTATDQQLMNKAFDRSEVKHLINLKTIHLSPTNILVAAKIELQSEYRAESATVINRIEEEIRRSFPQYKIYIYIETDVYQMDYQVKSE
uniref:Cation diffusion facilitator family transporter n=1 Tax=Prevotella sp. GTC17260 TaxID=3236796 RepID=A0AB33JER3_9BACT